MVKGRKALIGSISEVYVFLTAQHRYIVDDKVKVEKRMALHQYRINLNHPQATFKLSLILIETFKFVL